MKNLLICINIFLAVALLYGISKQFTMPAVEVDDVKAEVSTVKSSGKSVDVTIFPDAEQLFKIASNNIFDTSKVSGAFSQRSNATLKLVGISRIGDTAGAVILQTTSSNTNNRNPMQRTTTTTTTADKDYSFKQFIRLGETNSSGYTLSEIKTKSVVLTRGGERLELALQDASENSPSSTTNSTANQTATPRQNMQDAMNTQMMMNSQMMMMMQRVMNQQSRGTSTSTVSGSRGGTTSSGGASFGGMSSGGMSGGGMSGGGGGGGGGGR